MKTIAETVVQEENGGTVVGRGRVGDKCGNLRGVGDGGNGDRDGREVTKRWRW